MSQNIDTFFIFTDGTEVEISPIPLRPFIGPLYYSWMIDDDDCAEISAMNA
jgi:hypothetical protein